MRARPWQIPLPGTAIVGLVVLLTVSGCGGIDKIRQYVGKEAAEEKDPIVPAALPDFTPTATIRELWSSDSGSGGDELYVKLTPVISQQKIYTVDRAGRVQARSTDNGRILWRSKTRLPISAGIGAGGDMVLIGSSEGDVAALDAENGAPRWQTRVSSEVLSPPQRRGRHVVVRTGDGSIHCLDAASGQGLWVYNSEVPPLTLRGASAPVLSEDVVIVGLDDGSLAVLEIESGKEIWNLEISAGRGRSELDRMVDIDAQPIVNAGIIYVASFQGEVLALQIATGKTLWQRRISTHSNLDLDNSRLYISDDRGHVWALDRFTGETLWTQEGFEYRRLTAPARLGELVAVGDLEGYLHWLDRFTGEPVARRRASRAPILAPPLATGEVLYTHSSDGTISAWTYNAARQSEPDSRSRSPRAPWSPGVYDNAPPSTPGS